MKSEKEKELFQDWQETVDAMARMVGVPAGLIMRLDNDELEVFISSRTKNNPYKVGSREVMKDSGLYCEMVINSNHMLLIPDALQDKNWENNPDVKLNMISYLGFPIRWSNGNPFGTICVLDNKGNSYTSEFIKMIKHFRDLIEGSLKIIENTDENEKLANIDPLTNIFNRRAFFLKAEEEFVRATRFKRPLSTLLIDVDHFKNINDKYGHQVGDTVLVELVNSISSIIRPQDIFARYGGEEFIVILPETNLVAAMKFAERVRTTIENNKHSNENIDASLTVSIGVTEIKEDSILDTLLVRADLALYQAKELGRNCVCDYAP
jgi:diguanylate cyclase (GGDEF)-like protein